MADVYAKVKKEADKAIRKAVLHGEYPYIPALEDQIGTAASGVYLGVMEIPLAQVVGTVTNARGNMFACNFLPCAEQHTEFAAKWNALYKYQEEEGITDAVTVTEYKHRFYVKEGNKRVSVMKYLKMPVILAEVTRILPSEHDPLYDEFLAFYRVSGLYEPEFSKTGSYEALARMLGEDLEQKWSDETKRRLKALYYRFCKAYTKRNTEESALPAGDVFLSACTVYGLDALRGMNETQLDQAILKMKPALKKEKKDLSIAENPLEEESSVLDLRKVLPFPLGAKTLHAAFIYDSDASSSASVFEHELGRILVEKRLDGSIVTEKYENCGDAESLGRALNEAGNNCSVILTTSPSQYKEAYKYAVRHPEKNVFNCSLNTSHKALPVYGIRMYEAYFVLGVLAAIFADSHRIAYLAESYESGAIANINAFAIGAAMVDPRTEVILSWKENLDADWQQEMQKLGISVFCSTALPDIGSGSIEYGIYTLSEAGPVRLAVPVINWGNYYTKMLKPYADGTVKTEEPVSLWWGMSADVLDVNVSGSLPYSSRKLVQLLRSALKQGRLDPFDGELHSQNGPVKGPYDARFTQKQILAMDWLCDNVIGVLPPQKKEIS